MIDKELADELLEVRQYFKDKATWAWNSQDMAQLTIAYAIARKKEKEV